MFSGGSFPILGLGVRTYPRRQLRSRSVTWAGRLASAIALLACLVLTACASVNLDWEFEPKDAVGVWEISSVDEPAEIEFKPDGSVRASEWPLDICSPSPPPVRSEIDWGRTVSFVGEWKLDVPEMPYSGYILVPDSACSGISFYFLRDSADNSLLKFYLSPTTDSKSENFILFTKTHAE